MLDLFSDRLTKPATKFSGSTGHNRVVQVCLNTDTCQSTANSLRSLTAGSILTRVHTCCKGALRRLRSLNTVYEPTPPVIVSSLFSPGMSEEKEQAKTDRTSPIQATEESRDAIDEKKLLRKLDLNLLPAVTFLFFLSFMDRNNGIPSPLPFLQLPLSHRLSVGNARIEGLAADTHMSACSLRCSQLC